MTATLDRGRLLGWTILVSVLALIGYASRAAGGKPPANAAYHYSTAAGGVIHYGIILAIVLAVARPEWRPPLALRPPSSYRRAIARAPLAFVPRYTASKILSIHLQPDRQPRLYPD